MDAGSGDVGAGRSDGHERLTALVGEEVDLELQHVELRRRQQFAVGALASVASAGLATVVIAFEEVPVPDWVGVVLLLTTLVFLGNAALQERTLRALTRAAVQHQHRTRELEATVSDLGALHDIAQRVNAVLLPEEIYATVLAGAVELLGGSHGSIRLKVGDDLAVAASIGQREPVGTVLPVANDRDLSVIVHGDTVRGDHPPRVAVPVTVGRRHVGVLEVARGAADEPFTERLALMAQLFAEEAATAFVNANRYDVERARNEELVAATEDRSDAVADTVHDLRAPLAGLSGYAQLLRDRFDALGPERQREAIEGICQQADRLGELIGGLFEEVSAEARATRTREAVDVSAIVRTAVTSVEAALVNGGRGVRIDVDTPPALIIDSDPDALLRVVTNLVGNAAEHGGQEVVVRVQARAREVRIHVGDRGRGIPADELEDLFRRRTHPDGSPRGRGLAIVDALVRALGGRVGVRSKEGVGSVFTVRLPTRPPAAPRAAE